MPATMGYMPPDDKARMEGSLTPINRERLNRQDEIETSVKYYNGDHKKHLNVRSGEPDDNVIFNLYQIVVDRTSQFLFPKMVSFEVEPNELSEGPDELYLRQAWEASGGPSLFNKMAIRGGVAGHVYLRLLEKRRWEDYPRIVLLDPLNMSTYWYADDPDTVAFHTHYWASPDKEEYVTDYVFDGEAGTWKILKYRKERGSAWDLYRTIDWKSSTGPVVSFQHMPNPFSFYGYGENRHISLQDKINLVLSINARINRFFAAPKTVALGVEPSDIVETDIAGLWATSKGKAEADIYNLEMESDGSFSMALFQSLYDAFLAQSRTVVLKGNMEAFQRVTNTGVRTAFMDMLAKMMLLRWSYGNGIQQASRELLRLGGKQPVAPTIVWPDPLPTDQKELIEIATMEQELQVASRSRIAARRGINWNAEIGVIESEEKRIADINQIRIQGTMIPERNPSDDNSEDSNNEVDN